MKQIETKHNKKLRLNKQTTNQNKIKQTETKQIILNKHIVVNKTNRKKTRKDKSLKHKRIGKELSNKKKIEIKLTDKQQNKTEDS